jgi:cytochrome c oxidase cbb3-type subunit I/II
MRRLALPSLLLSVAALGAACVRLAAAEGPRPFDLDLHLRGERIFERQCAPCHGRGGRGDGDWAAEVANKPRDFTAGVFKFRSTPPGTLPTEADLVRTLRTGITGTMMPTFAKLTSSELRAVIAYVRSFSKRWEDPRNYAEPVPLPASPPAWFFQPAAAEAARLRGAALFAAHCAACHGPAGHGDGPAAAGLRDHTGRPIAPAVLAQPHHKSGDSALDLYRTIAVGLDGTPMAGFLPALGPDALWDLVVFIRALPPAAAAPSSSGPAAQPPAPPPTRR